MKKQLTKKAQITPSNTEEYSVFLCALRAFVVKH
jgi:hypothetical protein